MVIITKKLSRLIKVYSTYINYLMRSLYGQGDFSFSYIELVFFVSSVENWLMKASSS